MKQPYAPWTRATIVAELQALGCRCDLTDVAVASSVSQVEGDTWSYRARHVCPMCRTSVVEIADPNYVMPADVDR